MNNEDAFVLKVWFRILKQKRLGLKKS